MVIVIVALDTDPILRGLLPKYLWALWVVKP